MRIQPDYEPRLLPIYRHDDGEPVLLLGPIQLEPLKERNRIRLVRVKFYHYFPSRKGYVALNTHTALGWQGDHAVHLLGPVVSVPDSMYVARELARPRDIEDDYVFRMDKEDIEDWFLEADLAA